MRSRPTISLFPFLSVLLATMGVLAFLAINFMLFSQGEPAAETSREPVEVRWVGAPEHVRPLLVACRERGLVFRNPDGSQRLYTREDLNREVEVVRALEDRAYQEMGASVTNTRLWLYFKNTVESDSRLADTFTRRIHRVEMDNLSGSNQQKLEEHYPVLLIYPEGVGTYEQASYLIETTTRLSMGLEPMLEGWDLPYTEHTPDAAQG